MVELSVIIPTLNRASYLRRSLASIVDQTFPAERYEIIVVDNGSTDNTKEVVDELSGRSNTKFRYFYEPIPGLHNGRHRGAREAHADILVYGDDDTLADREWLEGIWESFTDSSVGIAGGKVLPEWEEEPPQWVLDFWVKNDIGRYLGYLSLIDLGDEKKFIPPGYTYGCNFAVRKKVLFECGGFHPDGMPQELIRFRGDGETALSLTISNSGYKILYNPKASVKHIIPKSRLSEDYFCTRFFNQGISDSFTEIRNECKVFTLFQRISELGARMDEVVTEINEVKSAISGSKNSAAPVRPEHPAKRLLAAFRDLRQDFRRKKLQKGLSSALSKSINPKVEFLEFYYRFSPDDFHRVVWDFLNENLLHKNIDQVIRGYVSPLNGVQEYISGKCFTKIKNTLNSGEFFSKKEQMAALFRMIAMMDKARKREFISQFTALLNSHLESEWALQVLEDNFFSGFVAEDVSSLKLRRKLMLAWRKGKEYHGEQVRIDEGLLRHVLRADYMSD